MQFKFLQTLYALYEAVKGRMRVIQIEERGYICIKICETEKTNKKSFIFDCLYGKRGLSYRKRTNRELYRQRADIGVASCYMAFWGGHCLYLLQTFFFVSFKGTTAKVGFSKNKGLHSKCDCKALH